MLPVTRANLNHICCICLLDVRTSSKVYEVKRSSDISKVLKLTAYISILKNPINQKFVNDYCRKICEICFVKAQYSYIFREKIMASTAMLKELLESNDLTEQDIERLQCFCRICLNRQKSSEYSKYLNMVHLKWLKLCSGVRFTTLIDTETFRIKEGTNINEIAVINDKHFPKQLCPNCFKKLQNVEEFRKTSTQSFDYMISVMGDVTMPDEYPVSHELKYFKENLLTKELPQAHTHLINIGSTKQDCSILQTNDIKYQNELISGMNNVKQRMHEFSSDMESAVDTSNYSYIHQLENEYFEDIMEFMDDIPLYSDKSHEDITLNLNNIEFADCSDNINKNSCLRKTRSKKPIEKEENVDTPNAFIPMRRHCKRKKQIEKSKKLSCSPSKGTRNKTKINGKDETIHSDSIKNRKIENAQKEFVCKQCGKIFATYYAYKRHQSTEHELDSSQNMHECLICSNKFKRKGHLTHHIKTVHEKLRPFKCSYCPKSFSAGSSKRVHELTHTGDYPFACKWCAKGFRQSSQLKIHTEIHTSNPELLCPICKRIQKSKNDLENHLKSHSDKRLQCPLCGKFFTRNHHLKDHHNAVHLKLRPFKCEFCELAFGDRKTRRIHQKNHTEDRPITCVVCKSGFKTKFSLSRHMNQFGHKTENYDCTNKTKKNKTATFNEKLLDTFEL